MGACLLRAFFLIGPYGRPFTRGPGASRRLMLSLPSIRVDLFDYRFYHRFTVHSI